MATKDEALRALLVVRRLGVPAEAAGVGEGPPRAALAEARAVMKRAYRGR